MLKLLIADDEEDIRKGIVNFINWDAYGIEVCGEAEDGAQTLELIHELSPDILLIDIRMPEMDGLEVIESIHSRDLPVMSIIISGYDDFSYAQEALKLGVSSYLLKPCQPEEILETVLSVKSIIESKRSKKKIYDEIQLKFNENLPLIKDNYLNRLINFESRYRNKMLEDFELYKINIRTKNVVITIVRLDNMLESYETLCGKDIELMRFAIKNILGEVISSKFSCEVFENEDGTIIIANVDNELYTAGFLPLLRETKEFIRNNLEFTISIGIGRIYDDICDIQYSYNEAIRAIEAKFLMGNDCLIEYEALNDKVIIDTYYPIKDEKKILNCIQSGNTDELKHSLEEFMVKLNLEKMSKEIALKSCLVLMFSIYHMYMESITDPIEFFSQELFNIDSFLKTDTLNQIKEKLLKIAEEILKKVNFKKNSNIIIEQSLKYIKENYSKELSLEKVAGNVFVNPRYFCLLFKQTMGINFVDYVNELRVENACELLKNIQMKTYEIAYKVGFSDDKYFSQIFKRYKGMTPTQYRSSIYL